jgi:hypothetical protein
MTISLKNKSAVIHPTNSNGSHIRHPPELRAFYYHPPPCCHRVLYFVGGTFFGSASNFWYRQLLEGLVQQCGVAIVATFIPATVLQSPLQHVALAKRVREQFEMAYESVLQDEYSDAALQGAHLCHAWHSLFSRQAI